MSYSVPCISVEDYAAFVQETRVFPREAIYVYPALGLADEAGEVAGEVKRILRDDGGLLTTERRRKILIELGDALWYIAALAEEVDSDLLEIMCMNQEKLLDRMKRNVLNGSGDNR